MFSASRFTDSNSTEDRYLSPKLGKTTWSQGLAKHHHHWTRKNKRIHIGDWEEKKGRIKLKVEPDSLRIYLQSKLCYKLEFFDAQKGTAFTTMSFPAFSGLWAILIAATAAAPDDIPTWKDYSEAFKNDIMISHWPEAFWQLWAESRFLSQNLPASLPSKQEALPFQ